MSTGILSLLSKVRPPVNLIDFMNQAPFDELINVDLGQDRYKFIFNLDEKYQVTTTEGVFSQFYAQIIREIVHPDDRRLYADTMDPATIARRLAEAEVPGALVFQYRIQDLNGGWRWIEQFVIGGAAQGMAEDTFSCYVFDIQNRKEREEGKTRVSYRGDAGRFDALTGLPVERFDVNELFNRIHAILGKHGASIGFLPAIGATYSLGSASVYNLYDQASMACQEAKRDYKNRVMFFDPSMVSKAAEDYKILSDFREALRNGEITFHLQPFRIREFLNDTVYSDSMLNNIIGPAAIYVWHGDDVDIVRFNQQFYQSANVPDFDKRLLGIQRFMPENEAPLLLQLLQRAYDDRLNGSSGVLTFDRVGGDFSRYFIHFYFLNEDGKARRFYGASRDVTEMARLHSRLDLLARFTSRTVVFVVLKDGDYTCEVVAHGMEKAMGLTKSELEEELNTFRFHERLIPHNAHALRAIATRCIDADFVDDPSSDVRCTIAMRRETANSKRRHVSREDA